MENNLFNTNKDQSITFKVNSAMKNMLIEKAKATDADLSKYLLQMIIDKFSEEAKAERQKQEKIKEDERLKSEQISQEYANLDKAEHEKKLDFNHTPIVVPKYQISPANLNKELVQTDWKELSYWGIFLACLSLFGIFCFFLIKSIRNKLNNKKIEDVAKALDSMANNPKKRI